MNKLLAVIKSLAIKMVLSQKKQIIAEMNKKLDIPFANEADEKKLIEGIWELVEEAVLKAGK